MIDYIKIIQEEAETPVCPRCDSKCVEVIYDAIMKDVPAPFGGIYLNFCQACENYFDLTEAQECWLPGWDNDVWLYAQEHPIVANEDVASKQEE